MPDTPGYRRSYDRRDGASSVRSLWESGGVVGNGSDALVEAFDPLARIRAAVLRTADDRPACYPQPTLSVEQAILASTVTPAWRSGAETRQSRLRSRHLADLV